MQNKKYFDSIRLAERLELKKSEIISAWELCVKKEVKAAQGTEPVTLIDSLPEFLSQLCEMLLSPSSVDQILRSAAKTAATHGAQRAHLGSYALADVIHEYQVLREVLIEFIENYSSDLNYETLRIINKLIDAGIQEAATRFSTQAANQLKLKSKELYEFIEQAPSPMVILIGEEMRFSVANPAYERLVGRKVVGKTVLEAFSLEEVEHFLPYLKNVLKNGNSFVGKELPLNIADETGIVRSHFVNIGYHAFRDENGQIKGLLADAQDVTEQVEARKQILLEQHKLETIFKESPAAMALWRGPEMIFEMVNAQFQALFNDQDILGKKFLDAIPEMQGQIFPQLILQVLETGKPFVGREALARHRRTKNGSVEDRYYDFTYVRILDSDGLPYGVYNHSVDVTERVLARKKLEQNEAQKREGQERLEFALESAKMGAWTIELPNGKTTLSKQARQIFGYESEYENPNAAIDQFLHPDYRESAKENLNRSLASNVPYRDEILIIRPDGEMRWLDSRAQAKYNENGEPVLLAGIVMDITDRKKAETELKETIKDLKLSKKIIEQNEDRVQRYAEAMPQMAFMTDASGEVTYFNSQHYEYFGIERVSNEGSRWKTMDIVHSDDIAKTVAIWSESVQTGKTYQVEYRLKRHDGEYRWHLARAIPDRDENGNIVAWYGTNTDIHEQKLHSHELESARIAAERANEAKSAFLANMSHEIRTPLGAIMGFSELLRHSDLTVLDRAEYLNVIDRNSTQLLRVIDDILDLAKVESGKMSLEKVNFSLTELLADFGSLMGFKARENGIQFELKAKTPLPEQIVSDPVRIRQILNNMISNAIKFTAAGAVVLEVCYENEYLDFAVTDTGRGISSEQAKNLFKPFVQADPSTTRKYGGTGLGLALTKNLCHEFGGDFTLRRSEIGKGSTFLARLKAEVPEGVRIVPTQEVDFRMKPERKALDETKKLKGLRILLVEDSPDNQMLVKIMTKKLGAEISIASDGVEGVELALSNDFDVVLMDVQMPRKDGHTAVRELRQMGYKQPIIALTAHAMKEQIDSTRLSGFTSFVAKPIVREELVQAILQHAHES